MSSAMGMVSIFIILCYGIMFGLVVLVIYALVLAIKALQIYIKNNS